MESIAAPCVAVRQRGKSQTQMAYIFVESLAIRSLVAVLINASNSATEESVTAAWRLGLMTSFAPAGAPSKKLPSYVALRHSFALLTAFALALVDTQTLATLATPEAIALRVPLW